MYILSKNKIKLTIDTSLGHKHIRVVHVKYFLVWFGLKRSK